MLAHLLYRPFSTSNHIYMVVHFKLILITIALNSSEISRNPKDRLPVGLKWCMTFYTDWGKSIVTLMPYQGSLVSSVEYILLTRSHNGTLAASVENYWLPHWSNEDLLHQQQKNPDITQVLNWLEDDILPETFPFLTSHAVQSLWSQRQ